MLKIKSGKKLRSRKWRHWRTEATQTGNCRMHIEVMGWNTQRSSIDCLVNSSAIVTSEINYDTQTWKNVEEFLIDLDIQSAEFQIERNLEFIGVFWRNKNPILFSEFLISWIRWISIQKSFSWIHNYILPTFIIMWYVFRHFDFKSMQSKTIPNTPISRYQT